MSTTDATAPSLRLIVEAGPEQADVGPLAPGLHQIGRAPENDVLLHDVAVSRQHARLSTVGERWLLRDLGSTRGTHLNSRMLGAHEDVVIVDGDQLRIGPWTLRVQMQRSDRAPVPASLRRLPTLGSVPQLRLRALFALAETAQTADDEGELLTSICRDLGETLAYDRVAVLRDAAAAPIVCALHQRDPRAPERAFSTTLIRAAEPEQPALLESIAPGELGASLIANPVAHALCIQLSGVSESTWLYLDREQPFTDNDGSVLAYVEAAARILALALSHRSGLRAAAERERLRAEFGQARAVQQQLCASRAGSIGACAYAFSTEPGAGMCGDFVDVLQADDSAVWAMVGDVVGHGAAAAMLMASALAILRSECRRSESPAAVADHLATELAAVLAPGQFITLWLARIDVQGGIAVVDAGHGQCWIAHAGGGVCAATLQGHPPIGVVAGIRHRAETLPFRDGDRLIVATDGYSESLGDPEVRQRCLDLLSTPLPPVDLLAAFGAAVARTDDDASLLVLERSR